VTSLVSVHAFGEAAVAATRAAAPREGVVRVRRALGGAFTWPIDPGAASPSCQCTVAVISVDEAEAIEDALAFSNWPYRPTCWVSIHDPRRMELSAARVDALEAVLGFPLATGTSDSHVLDDVIAAIVDLVGAHPEARPRELRYIVQGELGPHR
jgi:hypothetical protein